MMRNDKYDGPAHDTRIEFLPIYKSLQNSILRFTEVLVLFVVSGPEAITLEEIARRTRRRKSDLKEVIQSLLAHGQIKPHRLHPDSWELTCHPSEVTLESVLMCAIAYQDFGKFRPASQLHGVDALLVSAFMSISQSIHRTLGEFSLDQIPSTVKSSMPSAAKTHHFSI